MTLDTSKIINNRIPSRGINKIRNINNNIVPKFIFLRNNTEIPIYLLNINIVRSDWNYESRKPKYCILLKNTIQKNLTYDNLKPIKSFTTLFKDCFINSYKIHTFEVGNKTYYVGKGIILDDKFIPLLLITSILEIKEPLEYKDTVFESKNTNVYLSRKIYSKRFQEEDKKLYRVLFTDVIPSIIDIEDIKITIKDNLDIFKSVEVDSSKSVEQLNKEFLENSYHEFEQEIISKLP